MMFDLFQPLIDDTARRLAEYKQKIEKQSTSDALSTDSDLSLEESLLKLNLIQLRGFIEQLYTSIKKGQKNQADEVAKRNQLATRLRELAAKFRENVGAKAAQVQNADSQNQNAGVQQSTNPAQQPQSQIANASNNAQMPESKVDNKVIEEALDLGDMTSGICSIAGDEYFKAKLAAAQAENGAGAKPDFKRSLELVEISSEYCKAQKHLDWSNFMYSDYAPLLDRLKEKMEDGTLNDSYLFAFIQTSASIEHYSKDRKAAPAKQQDPVQQPSATPAEKDESSDNDNGAGCKQM